MGATFFQDHYSKLYLHLPRGTNPSDNLIQLKQFYEKTLPVLIGSQSTFFT